MSFVPAAVRALVIDDNDFSRELVAMILREIGFREIAKASDGGDALAQIEAADPGVIVCDVAMTPMDGFEFVAALRRHPWPGGAAVPVIFLTAHADPAIVERAASLGVAAHLVKPVQKVALEAQIKAVLGADAAR